jgi:hypothetical protein
VAASLRDVILADLWDAQSPPAEGATDSAGMRQRIHRMGATVESAARGSVPGVSLEEARQQLRDAQSALVAMGYPLSERGDAGAGINALWNATMQAAICAFQEDYDLEPTGHLDADTYEALMAAYEEAVETHSRRNDDEDDFDPVPHRHLQ